jgi:alpha-tubulin suppressor-like RCC1 family protein
MFNRKFWLLCGILLLFGSGGTVFGAILDAGYFYTCAIVNSGVKCWGNNEYGQLGDGTNIDRYTPVDVSGLTSVISIASGSSHSCVIISDGRVKCWGYDSHNQLGNEEVDYYSKIPVDVNGLTNGVIALGAGQRHSCALTSNNGVKCWGDNTYGKLGDGTDISKSTPVDVHSLTSDVVAIAVGGNHTCALNSSGGVKCWGSNWDGQLGVGEDNRKDEIPTPADVIGLTSGVTAIVSGWSTSCAILSDGTIKCWGANDYGQLGNGTTSYEEPTPVNVTVLNNSDVTAIALEMSQSCVLTNSGGVKCWGNNHNGDLGDNTTTDRLTPVDVIGLTSGVTAIALGSHSCALTSDGSIKCWGWNRNGELGDGTTERRLTPVNVKCGDDTTIVIPTPVDVDFDSTYEAGLNDAITQCQNDPASCGITASCSPVDAHASFSPSDGILTIPAVDVPDAFGGISVYRVEMSLLPAEGLVFSVSNAEPVQ